MGGGRTTVCDDETRGLLRERPEKRRSIPPMGAMSLLGTAGVFFVATRSSSSDSHGLVAIKRGIARMGDATLPLAKNQDKVTLTVGCTPKRTLSLLPFDPEDWDGKVGAKFVTLEGAPATNFFYQSLSYAKCAEHQASVG